MLPKGHREKAFYPQLAKHIIRYVESEDIAWHSEILNLRSSQAACLNILFPLKMDLDKAAHVLAPALPGVRRVTDVAFEYTGPSSASQWLGEPAGGKRGQNRTSIDAAIWWEDCTGQKRLTFVEFKYTERHLGGCRGYKSNSNMHPEQCDSLDVQGDQPGASCYLENRKTSRTSRHYWQHLTGAGVDLRQFGNVRGCPFRGPFYQLVRQYLLAAYCVLNEKEVTAVDVMLLAFKGNRSLLQVPQALRYLGGDVVTSWNTVLNDAVKLRCVYVEALSSRIPSIDQDWKEYLNNRYGL